MRLTPDQHLSSEPDPLGRIDARLRASPSAASNAIADAQGRTYSRPEEEDGLGLLGTFVTRLDRLRLRRPAARLASLVYGAARGGRQRFSIDPAGHWVNEQPEATIVSPVVHTTLYTAYRDWVIDNWCWGYMPGPGDTVIDAGAGVGEEAIVFSHLVGPRGRVISIEAHPATFDCLIETIRRSGLTNVTPLCIALAAEDGTARIDNGKSHLTSSIVKGDSGVEIPSRSLDSIARELGLGDVALVKMNIEGAETAAVRGMRGCAAQVRNVCISCHDFLADRGDGEGLRTKAQVEPLLREFGYSVATRPDAPEEWVRDYFYGSRKASPRS